MTANPVASFVIGLGIVLFASILNAGGLNLTKLDHVRCADVPPAARRSEWLRPLWVLGMVLYILSQLIGSTLALQYLRAEYVAPLGATSLIFNFLFASVLIGTPVTSTDIYGTIVVILGVVGIVAFGSINRGLLEGMDAALLHSLWSRLNWILFFIIMALTLSGVYSFASQLERVRVARADITAVPFAAQEALRSPDLDNARERRRREEEEIVGWRKLLAHVLAFWYWFRSSYARLMAWLVVRLEDWSSAKDDKTIAWTLGIAWACCGGGLAGLCLVFAKASVKLISGKLEHETTGNQFVHPAAFVTFFLLALTACTQIVCLNRALRAYDSTLVVPVFYGVYTGAGFLDSLVFNNEVDQYSGWTLAALAASVLVLVAGVVLLTHKKPENSKAKTGRAGGAIPLETRKTGPADAVPIGDEGERLTETQGEEQAPWTLGNVSDDEEDDSTLGGGHRESQESTSKLDKEEADGTRKGFASAAHGEEGRGLMERGDADAEDW